uniref:Putative disease resistance protein RPM1-like n=1 Tax=Davidia involucrata TaxID=16924 RepID=A0A5B7C093_DAVIN
MKNGNRIVQSEHKVKSMEKCKEIWGMVEVEMFEAMHRLTSLASEYEEEVGSSVEVTDWADSLERCFRKVKIMKGPLLGEMRVMVRVLEEMVDMLENELIAADRSSMCSWFLFHLITERRLPSLNRIARVVNQLHLKMLQMVTDTDPDEDEEKPNRYPDDNGVVGFEGYVTELSQFLVGEAKDTSVFVVGIVGIAGVGKTTLARLVFNASLIKKEFDCRVWIKVHHYRSDVMLDILQQSLGSHVLLNSSGAEEEEMMSEAVRNCLKAKQRVLVVLDDICDIGIWEAIKRVLPDGARVIFTTRDANLHHECRRVVSLGSLSKEKAWSLFCRKAMLKLELEHQERLKLIGQLIVGRCGGLPLAIALIACLLATKKPQPSIWAQVLKQMQLHGSGSLDGVLALAYQDLPWSLKACFIHCSLFPEDVQELPAKKLGRLWLAEGFIRSGTKNELEAGKYELDQLIGRNMIEAGRVGEVETCRLLRPMRSFCTNLLKASPRRLFVSWPQDRDMPSAALISSLHVIGTALNCHPFPFPALGKLKLLRVLDLDHIRIKELPNKMDHLVNLRYLGLRGTGITKFCSSKALLPKLLQTLDIRGTKVTQLPHCINHLSRLQHLYLCSSHTDKVIPLPHEIESLINLRKLVGVKITERLAQGLGALTRLWKFSGGQAKEAISESLCASLNKLTSLHSLAIKCDHLESFNLDTFVNYGKLSKLKLGGQLKKVDRVALMKSLTHIHLWDSMMDQDPLCMLQHLPNLVHLSLCNAYRGRLIRCDPQGFPKLKKLSVVRFRFLQEWGKIEGVAMQSLEELHIAYCPKLGRLPEGLADLDSLQAIQVVEVPLELEGNHRLKFKRIPKLLIVPSPPPL